MAAALFMLPGCRTVQPPDSAQIERLPLYRERVDKLQQHVAWSLQGRLAISDGRDGGSGRLAWEQGSNTTHMNFHGALGRGAWQLDADVKSAVLQFADGGRYTADTVDQLVTAQLGWQVPVESLQWWVRGLTAPGAFEMRELDPQGRLSHLRQAGWTIEYGRYGSFDGLDMPLKMTARLDDRSVKLAVRQWSFRASNE